MTRSIFYLIFATFVLTACTTGNSRDSEDLDAKRMLQGVWINDEQGSPAFYVQGDSIFYPDSISQPVAFWIYQDSLYLEGCRVNRYLITKQAEFLFKFVNQSGEEVKLVKSNDKTLLPQFYQYRSTALNQFDTFDTDTTASEGSASYACHIHVEPTTERVVKSSFNSEGIEVDNIYLDHAVSLSVTKNQQKLLGQTFLKKDFESLVPQELFTKSILRDIVYSYSDTAAVYFDAIIGIPDAATGYVVELKVAKDGKITKKVK